uniref:ThiF domain-containing protein n=1 Tax=Trichuris muris TaxID=70415 RepID=A0A5S6Q3K1_TRIMR
MESSHQNKELLTKQEAVVYDRQIRIWGFEGQSRIMKSDVLLIGLGPLGAESAKNLLLAGVHKLTLMDSTVTTEEDVNHSILLFKDCLGKQRAAASVEACKSINPFVNVNALDLQVDSIGEEDIAPYTVVVLADQIAPVCNRVIKLCRKLNVHFCCLSLYGSYAYGIFDFQKTLCDNTTSQNAPEAPLPAEVINGELLENGKLGEADLIECKTPIRETESNRHELRRFKNCLSAVHAVAAFEKSTDRRWSPNDAQVLGNFAEEGVAGTSFSSDILPHLNRASLLAVPVVSGAVCGVVVHAISEGTKAERPTFYLCDMAAYNGTVVRAAAVPELQHLFFD